MTIQDQNNNSSAVLANAIEVVERILLSIYSLMRLTDRRRQIINGPESRDLLELSRDAARGEKRAVPESTEARAWRNVREMAEVSP